MRIFLDVSVEYLSGFIRLRSIAICAQFGVSTTEHKTHAKEQKKLQNENSTVQYYCAENEILSVGNVWIWNLVDSFEYIIYPMHTSTQALRSLMPLYLVNMHGKTNILMFICMCVCVCICVFVWVSLGLCTWECRRMCQHKNQITLSAQKIEWVNK